MSVDMSKKLLDWTKFAASFDDKDGAVFVVEVCNPSLKGKGLEGLGVKGNASAFCKQRYDHVSEYVFVAPVVGIGKTRVTLIEELKFSPHYTLTKDEVYCLAFEANPRPLAKFICSGEKPPIVKDQLSFVEVWDDIKADDYTGLMEEDRSRMRFLLSEEQMDKLAQIVIDQGTSDDGRKNVYIDAGRAGSQNTSRDNSPSGIALPRMLKVDEKVGSKVMEECTELLSLVLLGHVNETNYPSFFSDEAKSRREKYANTFCNGLSLFETVRVSFCESLRPHVDRENCDMPGFEKVAIINKMCPVLKDGKLQTGRLSLIGFNRASVGHAEAREHKYGHIVETAVKYYKQLPENRKRIGKETLPKSSNVWDPATPELRKAHMSKTIFYQSYAGLINSLMGYFDEIAKSKGVMCYDRMSIIVQLVYGCNLNENSRNFRDAVLYLRSMEVGKLVSLWAEPGRLVQEIDHFYKEARKMRRQKRETLQGSRTRPSNNSEMSIDHLASGCERLLQFSIYAWKEIQDRTCISLQRQLAFEMYEKLASGGIRGIGPLLCQHVIGVGCLVDTPLFPPKFLQFGQISISSKSADRIRNACPALKEGEWKEHSDQLVRALSARLGVTESEAENIYCECGREGFYGGQGKVQDEHVFGGQEIPVLNQSSICFVSHFKHNCDCPVEMEWQCDIVLGPHAAVVRDVLDREPFDILEDIEVDSELPAKRPKLAKSPRRMPEFFQERVTRRQKGRKKSSSVSFTGKDTVAVYEVDKDKGSSSLLWTQNKDANNRSERTSLAKVLRTLPKVSSPGEFPGLVFKMKEAAIDTFGLMQYKRKDVIRTELKRKLSQEFQSSGKDIRGKEVYAISLIYKDEWVPHPSNQQLQCLLNNTPSYGDVSDPRLMYFSSKDTCEHALWWSVFLHPENRDILFDVFIPDLFSKKCRNPWAQQFAPNTRYLFAQETFAAPYCKIIRTLGTIETIDVTLINRHGYPMGGFISIRRG